MGVKRVDRDRQKVAGTRIQELDTPALLLDGPACQRNIRRLAEFFRDKPCQLRPHFKNHKCPTLARHQLQAGSVVGMTCATVGEAEVLVDIGFEDVLIANQVVGSGKITRLVDMARKAKVAVVVDHQDQIEALAKASTSHSVRVGVLVEVDIGMGRCGVEPGEAALVLAQRVSSEPFLLFEGIQAFEGHLVYVDDRRLRSERACEAMGLAVETRRLIEASGIPVPVISGGSTATYDSTGVLDGVDELQAGTYVTMDWRYHEVTSDFEMALSVLARVISARPGEAVLDVGVKSGGGEFGLPRIKGHPDVVVPFFLAEEHLVLRNAPEWSIGETVQLLPSHACTTCNLHRQVHVHDQGRVVDVWPIEA